METTNEQTNTDIRPGADIVEINYLCKVMTNAMRCHLAENENPLPIPPAGPRRCCRMGRHLCQYESPDRGRNAAGGHFSLKVCAGLCRIVGLHAPGREGNTSLEWLEGRRRLSRPGHYRRLSLLPHGEYGTLIHAGQQCVVPRLLCTPVHVHPYTSV